MSRTLYYTVKFAALSQKNPGFNEVTNAGNPYLEIGGIDTSRRQYSIEVGRGDPGENPLSEIWDYSEWSIGFSTFIKPPNYGATATYSTETGSHTYQIWRVMQVPDTFVIPPKYLSPTQADYKEAAFFDVLNWALVYAQTQLGAPVSQLAAFANQLSSAFQLHNALKTHLNDQFDAMNAALAGTIDVNTLLTLSDNASRSLGISLSTANINNTLGVILRAAAVQANVSNDPSHSSVSTNFHRNSSAGFETNINKYLVVGSPGNDALMEHGTAREVVVGGLGNDTVYGTVGNGILVGGAGTDTLDYAGMPTGLTISLEQGLVQGLGFTDRMAGFENATGGNGDDAVSGSGIDNVLAGTGGGDVLFGFSGNDTLDGGNGADTLNGGVGFDTARYTYGVFDPIRFTYTGVVVSLANPAVNTGQATGDVYVSIENIDGSDAGDLLYGDSRANRLSGYAGNDTLQGDDGPDVLIGGTGIDRLTGGLGKDFFVFDVRPSSSNRDTVTDFRHVDDTFRLENAVMPKLGAGVHTLNPAFFHAGPSAVDANDYVVYNKANGYLYYDSNGSAAGGATLLAVLANKPTLLADDFVVI